MVSRGADRFVLWPRYFDAQLSRAQGRRVGGGLAVRGPDARWVEVAARRAGLDPQLEEGASHPGVPYAKVGRVLVARKGSKQAVLRLVAEQMRASQEARTK